MLLEDYGLTGDMQRAFSHLTLMLAARAIASAEARASAVTA